MADQHGLLDALFAHGLDVRARRILFHGPVEIGEDHGKSAVEAAVKSLLYLDRSPGPIEFWINTPGGDVAEMWGLYDVLRTRSSVVTTIGFGEVASAGCLLLAAGDHRKATANCWFMWHDQEVEGEGGSLPALDARVRAWKREERRWREEMGRLTKRPAAWWVERTRGGGELWLDSRQLVQHGVVDEILQERVVR